MTDWTGTGQTLRPLAGAQTVIKASNPTSHVGLSTSTARSISDFGLRIRGAGFVQFQNVLLCLGFHYRFIRYCPLVMMAVIVMRIAACARL